MTYVPIKDYKCPFGVRDLTYGKDECYSGSGRNRCKYFERYDWDKHYGCIACTCTNTEQNMQPDLFGGNYD